MNMMATRILATVCFMGSLTLSIHATAEPTTVSYVDLSHYAGDWYEISHIPMFFERGNCACARQRLTGNADGTVGVYNSCNEGDASGPLTDIRGVATNDEPATNAKFTVDFNLPWKGTYWIVGLDSQYRYAVVTNKGADALYILSKTNTLAPDLYQEALDIAKAQSLKVEELVLTDHTKCSYPQ